jgi:hypothetical protein
MDILKDKREDKMRLIKVDITKNGAYRDISINGGEEWPGFSTEFVQQLFGKTEGPVTLVSFEEGEGVVLDLLRGVTGPRPGNLWLTSHCIPRVEINSIYAEQVGIKDKVLLIPVPLEEEKKGKLIYWENNEQGRFYVCSLCGFTFDGFKDPPTRCGRESCRVPFSDPIPASEALKQETG